MGITNWISLSNINIDKVQLPSTKRTKPVTEYLITYSEVLQHGVRVPTLCHTRHDDRLHEVFKRCKQMTTNSVNSGHRKLATYCGAKIPNYREEITYSACGGNMIGNIQV